MISSYARAQTHTRAYTHSHTRADVDQSLGCVGETGSVLIEPSGPGQICGGSDLPNSRGFLHGPEVHGTGLRGVHVGSEPIRRALTCACVCACVFGVRVTSHQWSRVKFGSCVTHAALNLQLKARR